MGTGNITLLGAVAGFSSFGSAYQNNSNVFYAITDGTSYEIGSGVYVTGVNDQLVRFPFKTTNNNSLVDFPEGIKEVYVTYPATHSVFTGSGLASHNTPQNSGVAYWSSANILHYDNQFIWDGSNHRLGINKTIPQYTIDIGGSAANSIIHSSGLLIGSSGVYFPSGNNGSSSYLGGRQLSHYEPNQLDQYAFNNSLIGHLTGSNAVIELSGVANQYILFKEQNAGTFFAGPASGCIPPCSPGHPSFRQLVAEDIPNLSNSYSTNISQTQLSGILNNQDFRISGILNNKINAVSGLFASSNIFSNGRLTTVSGDATNIHSTTASNKVYFSPYDGNKISLWNGSQWQTVSFGDTLVADLSESYYSYLQVLDVYAYLNNGQLAFQTSIWDDWNIRNTVNNNILVKKDGILSLSYDLTRRYMGTFVCDNYQTFDTPRRRWLFNYYNRINKKISSNPPSSLTTWQLQSYDYFRTIPYIDSVEIVCGYPDDNIDLSTSVYFISEPGYQTAYIMGIAGIDPNLDPADSTPPSPNSRHSTSTLDHIVAANYLERKMISNINQVPSGYHQYYAIECVPNTSQQMPTLLIDNLHSSTHPYEWMLCGVITGSWRC
jgi:hypothetical protein